MHGPAVVECRTGDLYSERPEEVKDKRTRKSRLAPCEDYSFLGIGINCGGFAVSSVP
jgi:hypothetical protein